MDEPFGVPSPQEGAPQPGVPAVPPTPPPPPSPEATPAPPPPPAAYTPPVAPPPAATAPYQPPPPSTSGGGKAIASLVLGIFGLLAWCLPIIGFPVSVTGLVLGIQALNGPKRGMAIAGIVLSSISLVLTLVNGIAGAYMGLTGQSDIVNSLVK